jgi:L-serine dehydratase
MIKSIQELLTLADATGQSLSEIFIQQEMDNRNQTRGHIERKMKRRLDAMRQSVERGLSMPVESISGMSGGDAYRLWQWLEAGNQPITGAIQARAIARAMAVNEVNAAMGCIVATPTAGSAGVLPGVLLTLQDVYQKTDEQVCNALFTAGGIGMIIASRSSISGAEGGCQAEIGAAAGMAAAAAVELLGGTPLQSTHAMALTLENMLGLVCDPVAGLVEVPCVKRNAGGVSQCFASVDLIMAGTHSLIPPDEVIDAMTQIGHHMDIRYRETAEGGLAATPTGRAWAKRVWDSTNPTQKPNK